MVQVAAWPSTSDHVCWILSEILGVQPPRQPDAVSSLRQVKVLWLGPHRWLIVRPVESQQDLASHLAARLSSNSAAVVELGAARCVFVLSGFRSRDVLAKQLPLDLSEVKFPVGRCAQSSLAHTGVLVHAEEEDTFEIFVYRDFAQHLWEVLADAGLEFRLNLSRSRHG